MPAKKISSADKVTADVDRLLSKERVLYSSRHFHSKGLWVVVDEHFEYHKDPKTGRTAHTVVKGLNDVYLQVRGQWIHNPCDVDRSLVYFNHHFEDGVGIVSDGVLRCILASLQDDEERATEAQQRSFRMGQAISLADKNRAEAEEDHRALRDPEVL